MQLTLCVKIVETTAIAASRGGSGDFISFFCFICNISPISDPSFDIENPKGINAVRSSSTKISWKRKISSIFRVTNSRSSSENMCRVAFLSLDGVGMPKLSGNTSDEFGEVRGSCECEGHREVEDNAVVIKVAEVGERTKGDIDKFEEELAIGRQLNVGSWRM
jgi:hypothetical protein